MRVMVGDTTYSVTWWRCPTCEMSMLFAADADKPECYRCGGPVFKDDN